MILASLSKNQPLTSVPEISALRRPRQEDCKFEANLGCTIVRKVIFSIKVFVTLLLKIP
jgi:hypothetical protein